jgi:hypothetical protein
LADKLNTEVRNMEISNVMGKGTMREMNQPEGKCRRRKVWNLVDK